MKTAFFFPVFLLLSLLFGCQHNEPQPAKFERNTAISSVPGYQLAKIVYTEGYNETSPRLSSTTTFAYNANGYLVKYVQQSTFNNGQPSGSRGATLTYNSEGLLARVDRFGGNPAYETYSYTNGKLHKVEFYENNALVYQYSVTTNSVGQITEMVGTKHCEKFSLSAYHVKFTTNKAGVYALIDFMANGRVDYQIQLNDANTTIQNPYLSWKGVPFDITRHFLSYVEEPPLSGWRAYSKSVTQIGEVLKGNYMGLRTLMETTNDVTVNANGFPIALTVKEFTDTTPHIVKRSTYEYTPASTL